MSLRILTSTARLNLAHGSKLLTSVKLVGRHGKLICSCSRSHQTEADEAVLNKKRSKKTMLKYIERRKTGKVDPKLEEYFASSRVFARLASSPGQCGRADGYILEGKELEFYLKRLK